MSIRKTRFAPEEYYHIYNRGNSKQVIFHDNEDHIRFLELLFLSNTTKGFNIYNLKKDGRDIFECERDHQQVSVCAYTLMPNHFHILVKQQEDDGISKFMQKLTTGYSMYYNRKYKRSGVLFEGKFKASHVDSDRYLKYLFSYIHLNCIKLIEPKWKEVGIKDKNNALVYVDTYKWSSYIDYSSKKTRSFSKILDKKASPNYFSSLKALRADLFSWLTYKL